MTTLDTMPSVRRRKIRRATSTLMNSHDQLEHDLKVWRRLALGFAGACSLMGIAAVGGVLQLQDAAASVRAMDVCASMAADTLDPNLIMRNGVSWADAEERMKDARNWARATRNAKVTGQCRDGNVVVTEAAE